MRPELAFGAALLLAGCASQRAEVVVASADGSRRYTGERTLGRADAVALTSERGAACAGDLHPTEDAATGAPASFAGMRCDDGRIGVLLFSGAPADGGGAVNGVMDRRPVSGGWGSAAPALDAGTRA